MLTSVPLLRLISVMAHIVSVMLHINASVQFFHHALSGAAIEPLKFLIYQIYVMQSARRSPSKNMDENTVLPLTIVHCSSLKKIILCAALPSTGSKTSLQLLSTSQSNLECI